MVLIDANVLISAALSDNATPFQAYVKEASYPNHGLICEQQLKAKTGVLLTGDNNFLESGMQNPAVTAPAEFLNYIKRNKFE